jgi:serine/threonine protein kinase
MERSQQIEEIFHEALQRDRTQREAYLRLACGSDAALRSEIAGLLTHHEQSARFEPWAAAAAARLIDSSASLQPGQSLGPYRIESFLAAGGMGEVYRATDTRLNREVAIKVSAGRFSERFEREARFVASMNHPNICHLYDVGPNYLVMELIEGSTLADRIQQSALPLQESLPIARQIAEALEAAHEKGRIHRDLKPANIKVTPEGGQIAGFRVSEGRRGTRDARRSRRPTDYDYVRDASWNHPGHSLVHEPGTSRRQASGQAVGHLVFRGCPVGDAHGQAFIRRRDGLAHNSRGAARRN